MTCRIEVTLLLISLIAGEVRTEDPGNFSIRAGVGYDFISQEYYLDSARYDPDSALTATLLKRDYLDDKKGLLYLKYKPGETGRQSMEVGWEQTPDIYRALGWGHFALGNYQSLLESDFHFELKNRFDGVSSPGEDFFVADGRLSWRKAWSKRFESKARLFGERVAFDSTAGFLYDHTRLGGDFGISYGTENFDSWTLTTGIEKRLVPDSNVLDYLIWRGAGGFLGEIGGAFLSALIGLEKKDYNWDDNRDNYYLYTSDFYSRIRLGKDFYLRPSGTFEYFDFQIEDLFSYDYSRFRPALLLEKELGGLTVSAGPKMELFSIGTDYEDDDFFEYGLSVGADYYRTNGLFLILENQVGRRYYTNQPEFYSDYWYDRLSLIGNIKIWRFINAELLFSGEWEWHDLASDDARLFLISSRLTCTF